MMAAVAIVEGREGKDRAGCLFVFDGLEGTFWVIASRVLELDNLVARPSEFNPKFLCVFKCYPPHYEVWPCPA